MISFTIDTNCIIDIDDNRHGADSVRALANAHADGRASVALVAISASERQVGDKYIENYSGFKERVDALQLGHLEELLPLAYSDLVYWDKAIYSSKDMVDREKEIHSVLFPNLQFSWIDFARSRGISVESFKNPEAKRWRNAFCDRQMFWAHDHNSRDVFVTSDGNFKRKMEVSSNFSKACIMRPAEAVALL
ncbi:MAG: hypothetical protein P1U83_18180 [Roseovarius sp.]|nr:hypothetical protein [Roseovarius sp.]